VIADALEVHPATVARVRQHYATVGLDAALYAKTPQREYRRRLDGEPQHPELRIGVRSHWTTF
jgi:hypothetical protein